MDALIIHFPGGGGSRARPAEDGGSAGLPASSSATHREPAVAYAELALRFVPAREDRNEVPHASVVLSAMEALVVGGAAVRLAGTSAHPVVEGSWRGDDACLRAAEAAADADIAIREASRGRLCSSVGIVRGSERSGDLGVISRSGATSPVDLSERAAPGQVLLGGDAWERESQLEISAAVEPTAVRTFVLRGLR